jgi:protocatechuate 3,4-dioxygenase alpha subunit
VRLQPTPSQTVGPYFSIGLDWKHGERVVDAGTEGAFWIQGRVLDGSGKPVSDALVETWQADPRGGFPTPAEPLPDWRGIGRGATDRAGRWRVYTVMPGAAPGEHQVPQAPHIDVSVFARGLLRRVVTRIYFADRAAQNASDAVLGSIPGPRRATLVAETVDDGYRFDIRLQGDGETVFFSV